MKDAKVQDFKEMLGSNRMVFIYKDRWSSK
jgi:hypothetical protein